MVTRRKIVIALGAGALAAPMPALSQQKIYRIGYLANQADPRATSESFKAFAAALRELGWIEGKNIEIRIRSSGGRDERFASLASEFVRENVDVIVTTGAASTRAAKAATDTIPIVFGSSANPIELKLVSSLSRPGGNVTGLAFMSLELAPKRLELLKEILPRGTRFARFYSASNPYMAPAAAHEPDLAARALGVTLQHMPITGLEDIESAMAAAARNRMDAVTVEADAVFVVNRARLGELALKHRLPMMGPDRRYAEAGALVTYGENFAAMYRRAGFFVDKILRGTKPVDLPVELPTVFELAVNLKTAEALGIIIADSVLLRADRVLR